MASSRAERSAASLMTPATRSLMASAKSSSPLTRKTGTSARWSWRAMSASTWSVVSPFTRSPTRIMSTTGMRRTRTMPSIPEERWSTITPWAVRPERTVPARSALPSTIAATRRTSRPAASARAATVAEPASLPVEPAMAARARAASPRSVASPEESAAPRPAVGAVAQRPRALQSSLPVAASSVATAIERARSVASVPALARTSEAVPAVSAMASSPVMPALATIEAQERVTPACAVRSLDDTLKVVVYAQSAM